MFACDDGEVSFLERYAPDVLDLERVLLEAAWVEVKAFAGLDGVSLTVAIQIEFP